VIGRHSVIQVEIMKNNTVGKTKPVVVVRGNLVDIAIAKLRTSHSRGLQA